MGGTPRKLLVLKCGCPPPPASQGQKIWPQAGAQESLTSAPEAPRGDDRTPPPVPTGLRKEPHVWTEWESGDNLGPVRPGSSAGSAAKGFGTALSSACTRRHTPGRGPSPAGSATRASSSPRTSACTSAPTPARGPSHAHSAHGGSPTTPRCARTAGPTPTRGPSAVTRARGPSATRGTCTCTSAPTPGSGPTRAAPAAAPSGSWAPSNATKGRTAKRPGNDFQGPRPRRQRRCLAARYRPVWHRSSGGVPGPAGFPEASL